jgi:phosphohistidine swiveling domain-containing protein
MAEDTSRPSGANKYSIYAQRSVDSTQMDWNAASKELVTGLQTIQADRNARKAAIEQSTQNAIEQLSKVPETGTQDAASLLINGSSMSVKGIQEQNNLLKRGLISPSDYKLYMQQQKNGYSSLSTAVKGWDDWAVQAKDRLQAAKDGGATASELEIFSNLSVEALGNLRNKKLWSNPTNGKMQLVTMGKNTETGLYDVMPDYEKRKQDYQNPNQIMNFMKFEQDRIDVDDMATAQTAQIADIIQITLEGDEYKRLTGGGRQLSTEDFRNLGDFGTDENGNAITYDMWKSSQLDAMIGAPGDKNNMNAAQVLTNSGRFFFAETESQFEERHPNVDKKYMIKVDMSSGQPVPEMTDSQYKDARRLADIAVESQVSHIEKVAEAAKSAQAPQQPNSSTLAQNKLDRSMVGYMDDANALASDDESIFEATAQDRIVALNKEMQNSGGDPNKMIDSITRDDTSIKFTLADGTVETIPRLDDNGVPRNAEEVVREVYRLITPQTSEYQNSYKDAAILYKKEPGGGFRGTDRDMTDIELIAAAKEKRAVAKLDADGIPKEIAETNDQGVATGKMIQNPAYEPALSQAILNDTDNITADEKNAVKKRILKNITGEKYRALAPLPALKQNTAIIGAKMVDGDAVGATGTELIEEKVGDKLSGLNAGSIGDDPVEVNDVLSQVMNDYLPDEIKGGAKVMFKKDSIDDSKWVIEVSYFDRAGVQQSLPPIYPEVGAMMNMKGATPSQLNEMMHKAAQEVLNEENARLTTRNKRGTGKNSKKFN